MKIGDTVRVLKTKEYMHDLNRYQGKATKGAVTKISALGAKNVGLEIDGKNVDEISGKCCWIKKEWLEEYTEDSGILSAEEAAKLLLNDKLFEDFINSSIKFYASLGKKYISIPTALSGTFRDRLEKLGYKVYPDSVEW